MLYKIFDINITVNIDYYLDIRYWRVVGGGGNRGESLILDWFYGMGYSLTFDQFYGRISSLAFNQFYGRISS
jgi:hypothetical protein